MGQGSKDHDRSHILTIIFNQTYNLYSTIHDIYKHPLAFNVFFHWGIPKGGSMCHPGHMQKCVNIFVIIKFTKMC